MLKLIEGHTDRQSVIRTDRPSFRDARTQLKKKKKEETEHKMRKITKRFKPKEKKPSYSDDAGASFSFGHG